MSQARSLTDLSEAQARLLDRLCDGFERSWQDALRHGHERPRLEAVLVQLDLEARDPGLKELLKVEIAQRRLHGEQPAVRDYADRFPEIGSVLSTLLAREGRDEKTRTCPFLSAGQTGMADSSGTETEATDAESIPGYRLMRRLGGGGMGEVFLASQLFSNPEDALRSVALKAIRPELLPSPRHRQIMENDIRIAAQLDHPTSFAFFMSDQPRACSITPCPTSRGAVWPSGSIASRCLPVWRPSYCCRWCRQWSTCTASRRR